MSQEWRGCCPVTTVFAGRVSGLLSVALLLLTTVLGDASFWSTHLGLCERPWQKVYEHDNAGTAVFGDLRSLTKAVTIGDTIRVVIHDIPGFQQNITYAVHADNVVRSREHVCIEALSSLNHFNRHFDAHAQSDVDALWHLLLCSTGNLHVLGLSLGNRRVISDRHVNASASWFTKSWAVGGDVSCYGAGHSGGSADGDCESPQSFLAWPVYSNFITGDPGGKKKISVLLEAVKRGQEVRGVMRDRGYSFPFHFVNWDTAQGWVGGHNVMHVGQRHFSSHVGMRREPAYMWLSSWSTTGRRHNSRWLLNGQVSVGANQDSVSLDWMTDSCWRHIFTNDARGQREQGSLEELLLLARGGHRVRVVVGNMAAEADVLKIRGGHLSAQLLKQLSPVSSAKDHHHLLHDQARWSWQVVHTTGTIWRHEVLLGNHSVVSETRYSSAVSWFVDTRPWSSIYHSANNTIIAGSTTDIGDAVVKGADVRVRLRHVTDNGDIFAPAVNLKIEGGNSASPVTSAQVLRYLSDEDSGDTEVRLQGELTWWMTSLDTRGVMSLQAWNTARKAKYFDITLMPEIEWFVNY
ncbi:hypothetical protein V1264_019536 [Littorina saxatilis]|uniref:Uncharacterized protein n=2 Tax=Littorina saxatilis TaxID=31220 RepID=A0AAN9BEV3_9CAEN